ncbi:hypothetical protein [Halalkalicoccus jeotgali]|uniref:Uncharacterized protein n=1 Tax=Halalkalicoccus jeotgali (strain DSM 18796 / CECT 7217 / JCM 14584 / KCTC 4019 / B3) TaxID=795797 RepID=D8J763_HALJB|nr:hypothetical protein [Halalkalicoccus jeotgali]ADJ13958.1 hypothetical protein HacjB3_02825 [Halalkalicoccus jeotgali B3]ELY33999.1 hypothetical protein C497_16497 [Halalkalicoccus jeotgali B3]
MDDDIDNAKLDEYMVDQLRVCQEEIEIIRNELDEQTRTYKLLDMAVRSVSRGIDKGTIEWRLPSEDDRDISESSTRTED